MQTDTSSNIRSLLCKKNPFRRISAPFRPLKNIAVEILFHKTAVGTFICIYELADDYNALYFLYQHGTKRNSPYFRSGSTFLHKRLKRSEKIQKGRRDSRRPFQKSILNSDKAEETILLLQELDLLQLQLPS